MAQYRNDRNPNDLIFRKRAVVHFAVDQDTVAMTTELAGKAAPFLPFNQGSAGRGANEPVFDKVIIIITDRVVLDRRPGPVCP